MSPTGGALVAVAVVLVIVYARWVLRRNRRLTRPPILDADGAPIPERTLALSDGETVDYVAVGPAHSDGPAILLVPGADGMKETFRFQVPALARNHRVVCTSLRRGLSLEDSLDRMVDDVAELAAEEGIARFVLLGQSLGGAIAMRFAVRFPERVAGLALANTLARVKYDHVGLNRALLAPLAMATTRYLPTGMARLLARLWSALEVWIYDASPGRERIVEYALWTGPRTVPSSVSKARVARLSTADLLSQLPSIRTPTLVLKGSRDHYVPPAWSHEIVSLIPGARYREIAGTGHCSHLSMPSSFNGLLLEWLTTVFAPAVEPGASGAHGGPAMEVAE